jgi:hypothetical protein
MTTSVHPSQAVDAVYGDADAVTKAINDFTAATFRTRGGRLGSGMGSLIEALWVYYMNTSLQNDGGIARVCELAWLPDHQPADFACLHREAEWAPESRAGELFRIEAKSMNLGVDEAKGHFTNLDKETFEHDQLLVLVWSWTSHNKNYVWPEIHDYFIGNSLPIIRLRDRLHTARGGSFVEQAQCPDGCKADACSHVGEPLNASKKRERRSGPVNAKPANVDYAANFGGLLRMIKTSNPDASAIFRKERQSCDVCHRFISFIHKYYPSEEMGQYKLKDWRLVADVLDIKTTGFSAFQLRELIAKADPNYRELLRELD